MERDGRLPQNVVAERDETSAYDVAIQQFDDAAAMLGLDESVADHLRKCKRELTVNFPVRMDKRRRADVHRLQDSAQPRTGAGKGRHSLPSDGQPGRGEGPCHVDDLEVRGRRHPLRRRQGRSSLRPQNPVAG